MFFLKNLEKSFDGCLSPIFLQNVFKYLIELWLFLVEDNIKVSSTYLACLTTAKLSDEKQHFTQRNQTWFLHALAALNFVFLEMFFFNLVTAQVYGC